MGPLFRQPRAFRQDQATKETDNSQRRIGCCLPGSRSDKRAPVSQSDRGSEKEQPVGRLTAAQADLGRRPVGARRGVGRRDLRTAGRRPAQAAFRVDGESSARPGWRRRAQPREDLGGSGAAGLASYFLAITPGGGGKAGEGTSSVAKDTPPPRALLPQVPMTHRVPPPFLKTGR